MLVHCGAGVSRSAALCIAYLMRKNRCVLCDRRTPAAPLALARLLGAGSPAGACFVNGRAYSARSCLPCCALSAPGVVWPLALHHNPCVLLSSLCRWSAQAALDFVKSRRSLVAPNDGWVCLWQGGCSFDTRVSCTWPCLLPADWGLQVGSFCSVRHQPSHPPLCTPACCRFWRTLCGLEAGLGITER